MSWTNQYSPRPEPQPQQAPEQVLRESLQKQLAHGSFILVSPEQARLIVQRLEEK